MADLKARMRVDRVYTDKAFHPDRRRVKYFPMSRVRNEAGQGVIVDNEDWVGDYPILWSRPTDNGQRIIVMLIDDERGTTAHALIDEPDFLKLPETDIHW